MKKIIFIFFVSTSIPVLAQETEFWCDINLYKNLNKRLTLFGDAGPRVTLNENSPYGFYIRPSISYKISDHATIGGGLAWFQVTSPETKVHEIRGWQGIRFEWKVWNRLLVSNYNRIEERWFVEEGNRDFLLRFRILGGVTIPINHSTLLENTWYIPLAYEVFEDLNDHQTVFINRTRVYAGIGYVANSNIRIELFYIDNESRSNPGEELGTVNVIRLRIHFTFPERPVLVD